MLQNYHWACPVCNCARHRALTDDVWFSLWLCTPATLPANKCNVCLTAGQTYNTTVINNRYLHGQDAGTNSNKMTWQHILIEEHPELTLPWNGWSLWKWGEMLPEHLFLQCWHRSPAMQEFRAQKRDSSKTRGRGQSLLLRHTIPPLNLFLEPPCDDIQDHYK